MTPALLETAGLRASRQGREEAEEHARSELLQRGFDQGVEYARQQAVQVLVLYTVCLHAGPHVYTPDVTHRLSETQ